MSFYAQPRPLLAIVAAAFVSLMICTDVAAQDTRAELIEQEQLERLQQVTPSRANALEGLLDRLEDWGLIVGQPRGVYPWFGSVYPGGGFAAGAGARKPFGDDGSVNVYGAYSISAFTRVQADLALPSFARDRARLTLSGRYVDAPDVRYFGVGNSTLEEDETRFGYTPTTGSALLDVNVGKGLSLGAGAKYHNVETNGGRTAPSIEDVFSPSDTPGLELSTFNYVNGTAFAVFDWRRNLGYSGRGGMYRVQFDDFREQDSDQYSFKSLEAEVIQLVPILRANWVIALRGLATVTDLEDSGNVPHFLLPSLGGGSTLRGYPDFRFQDRNRLLMNAELRWTPARFLDMAIFYDTGKVASRREDLDFEDLKSSYGIGMRFIGTRGYAFRIEAARSQENNLRLIVGAGGGF
ncbi:MAG TPA: BamA/TamA family outer membrane protein [Vicinamibacterales bacterium]|nr:BamA/TamA family outer membrane protein [Vicinamibacterales bacterium]